MTKILIATIGLSISVVAQAPTIPEIAAKHRGKTITVAPVIPTLPPLTLSDFVDKSDVIMVGRLSLRRAYLSGSEHHVYSEFVVIPRQTLVDKTGFWSRNPSATLTLYGGEITIGTTTVRRFELEQRRVQTEKDYLLFLSSDQNRGALIPSYGTASVFEVLDSGRLACIASHVQLKDVQGEKLDAVVRRISMR